MMSNAMKSRLLYGTLFALIVGAAAYFWQSTENGDLPEGVAGGNGRVEAVEIDIASMIPGRVEDIMVTEGEFVTVGQALARMDTSNLQARLQEAQAYLQKATTGIDIAQNFVVQRQAELRAAQAVVLQRRAELNSAQNQLERTRELVADRVATEQRLDQDTARYQSALAAVSAGEAQTAAVQAAIRASQAQVVGANADVQAAQASIGRIKADIDEGLLKAPRNGRVQYLVVRPGEIVPGGGVILNMVDLTDVYMTFFLPTKQAGLIALDDEARIVLDVAPQFVIPARISFVSDVAQFTPKTIETQDEREKLMFSIRARVDRDLLERYLRLVKTGLPGMAYVRTDATADWPETFQVQLPQ